MIGAIFAIAGLAGMLLWCALFIAWGDQSLGRVFRDLREAFNDLGKTLLDTVPLEGLLDRLSEWLDGKDWGLIAFSWSPDDSHGHKTERLGDFLLDVISDVEDGLGDHLARRKPLPIPDDLPASILSAEPIGPKSVRVALAGEVLDTASVRIAPERRLYYEDLDEFTEKVEESLRRAGLTGDENPVPEPPLRETSKTFPYGQRKVSR